MIISVYCKKITWFGLIELEYIYFWMFLKFFCSFENREVTYGSGGVRSTVTSLNEVWLSYVHLNLLSPSWIFKQNRQFLWKKLKKWIYWTTEPLNLYNLGNFAFQKNFLWFFRNCLSFLVIFVPHLASIFLLLFKIIFIY